MHYKNGREAKNGDVVVFIPKSGTPYIGILYNATARNDYCNGRLAQMKGDDPYPNLIECLHIDDVKADWVSKPSATENKVEPAHE